MGRVSRILKAASEKPPSGLEIEVTPGNDELPRLIACWPRLPAHFKRTIMALVETVETQRSVPGSGAK